MSQVLVHLVLAPSPPYNHRLMTIPSRACFVILQRLSNFKHSATLNDTHSPRPHSDRLSLCHSSSPQFCTFHKTLIKTSCVPSFHLIMIPGEAARPRRCPNLPAQAIVPNRTVLIPLLPPNCPRRHPRPPSSGSREMSLPSSANPFIPKHPSNSFHGWPYHASLQTSYTHPHIANTTSETTIRLTRIPNPPTLAAARPVAARPLLHIPLRPPSHCLAHPRSSSPLSDGTRPHAPQPQSAPRAGNVLTARISSAIAALPISSDISRPIRAARRSRTGCVVGCP